MRLSVHCRTALLFLCCIALCTRAIRAGADAPKPEIKSASEMGLRAGRTTNVILYGENLAPKVAAVKSPVTVKLGETKATDEKTKNKGSKQVTLEVTVPANCPRDTFELTLTNQDGVAVKTNLCVVDDAAVEAPIKKPAATFATAMPLQGTSEAITGTLDGDQPDIVRIDAKANEVWDVSLLTGRAGSMLDPVLRIRDKRHLSLALSVGDKKKDRHIVFTAPADGPYYVEITEAEARGGAGYNYRLTITRKK